MKFEITHNGETTETKDLQEGSYKIGRSSTCEIQLKSPNVSKQHAMLVVKGNKAAIVDVGSSNGVFVNGILVRKQRIEIGDEIAISDYRIRISTGAKKVAFKPKGAGAPAPGTPFDGNLALEQPLQDYGGPEQQAAPMVAMTPQEKLILLLDERVLAPFYALVKQVDWRLLLISIQGITLLAAVFLSVFPIVRWGKRIVTEEALSRAHTVISQSVRENFRVIAQTDDFTRLTVDACEAEQGMLSCVVVEPRTNTIMAPAKFLNKPITDFYMLAALKRITDKKEEMVSEEKDLGLYIVAQPISVFSSAESDKQIKGIVMAEFEIPAKVYSTFEPLVEAALFAILCSLMAYFFIFKMFTYPIISLHEQLDAVLKGDQVNITANAKSPELEALATVMNFSASRIRQGAGISSAPTVSLTESEQEDKDYEKYVLGFDQATGDGVLLLDRDKKVRFVGHVLEDLISMRNQYAVGQNISDACRDQSFAGTTVDLADRVLSSFGETQNSQLDVNGISRTLVAIAQKNRADEIRYILIVVRMS